MRVLIETRMNSLKLTESKHPKKGCLGRLEGVCADYKNPTRNGRLYPLELWERVFKDTLFKESLENKTLFGELDHPEDRFEPLISEACVVMTDYRIDKDKGLIYGGFDILDTPKGRILKSIVDYGSVVGVSSRGQGDIVESVDGEMVDAESYEFACFDVVSTPAVEKARQTVAESIKRIKTETFTESVKREIQEAATVADLNIIRSVIRASNLNDSEMDSLVESIEDKCKSLQTVGETITAKGNDSAESLVESTSKENSGSANTIRDKKKLFRCINKLREQVSAYQHREKRYLEMISQKDSDIESLKSDIRKLDGQSRRSKKKYESITSGLDRKLAESTSTASRASNKANMLEQRVSKLDSSIRTLKDENARLNEAALRERKLKEQSESSARKLQEAISREKKLSEQLQRENAKLQSEISTLKQSAIRSKRDVDRLTETVKSNTSKETTLHETISQQKSRIRKLEEDVRRLSEDADDRENELRQMDSELNRYSTLLEQAQIQVSDSAETISQLKESLKESNSKGQKVLNELRRYQESYLRKVSSANGLNPEDVKKSVNGLITPKEIDTLVESLRDTIDRNNNVGISHEGIKTGDDFIVESISGRPKNADDASEEQRLATFLDMASGNSY